MTLNEQALESLQALQARLSALERDIDAGRYRPGPWQALLRDVRRLPRSDRAALAASISCISDRLHARTAKRTLPFAAAVLAEMALATAGAVLLWFAVQIHSSWAAVAGALLWTISFQPLIKILIGSLLGIRYAYAYLLGPEPRFKMRFGSYIAAPRLARILLHLFGTIGSPLGAWLPTRFLPPGLRVATTFCWVLFGIVVLINVAPLVLALAGLWRVGPLKLSLGSAASAALEIREALGH